MEHITLSMLQQLDAITRIEYALAIAMTLGVLATIAHSESHAAIALSMGAGAIIFLVFSVAIFVRYVI